MAATAFVITASVGSAVATARAADAQNEAQKKANKAQRRSAELENARQARRAIAARRLQQAELLQATANEGVSSSSAVSGAVGSLQTQTAANIGAGNTRLAGQIAENNSLVTGANRARRFGNVADLFAGLGGIVQTGSAALRQRQQQQQYQELIQQLNSPLRNG